MRRWLHRLWYRIGGYNLWAPEDTNPNYQGDKKGTK